MALKEPIFSDIDPRFRVDYQGNLVVLENADAVNFQIETLFGTSPGERVMYPLWGSELSTVVGESVSEGTADFIRMILDKTLGDGEPRVTAEFVRVTPKPDENAYHIQIGYRLDEAYIRALFERMLEV